MIYDSFLNLKNVLESTEEKVSDEDSRLIKKIDVRYFFHDYFLVPDTSKIGFTHFEIDIYQINILTSTEEDSLIDMFTKKLQFNQKSFKKF